MELRDWPEIDLIRPAGANGLIVGFKAVRTIGFLTLHFYTSYVFPGSLRPQRIQETYFSFNGIRLNPVSPAENR